jgi:hypothetical protein
MKCQEIVALARAKGFLTDHFLRMRDLKSGTEISGKFVKYKQHKTIGLRIKNDYTEVEIIKDGEFVFEILDSVNLETGIRVGDKVAKKSKKPFKSGEIVETVKGFTVNPKDPKRRIVATFEVSYCGIGLVEKVTEERITNKSNDDN